MLVILTRFTSTIHIKRFMRFLTVGMSGTLLDFSILTVLKLFGLPTLFANTISYTTGIVNNFYWNRRWTFSKARGKTWQRQFITFAGISLVGLVLNNALVVLLEPSFDRWLGSLGYLPAKIIATGVVVFWNYLANLIWTFKETPQSGAGEVAVDR